MVTSLAWDEALVEELQTNQVDKKEAETADNGGLGVPLLRRTTVPVFPAGGDFKERHSSPFKL